MSVQQNTTSIAGRAQLFCVTGLICAGLAWPHLYALSAEEPPQQSARLNLRHLEASIDLHRVRRGELPAELKQLAVAGGPLQNHHLKDPWGMPIRYRPGATGY